MRQCTFEWLSGTRVYVQVLEMRYGTLRIRLETARDRLKMWIHDDGQSTIPELEQTETDEPPYPLWQDDNKNLQPLVRPITTLSSRYGQFLLSCVGDAIQIHFRNPVTVPKHISRHALSSTD